MIDSSKPNVKVGNESDADQSSSNPVSQQLLSWIFLMNKFLREKPGRKEELDLDKYWKDQGEEERTREMMLLQRKQRLMQYLHCGRVRSWSCTEQVGKMVCIKRDDVFFEEGDEHALAMFSPQKLKSFKEAAASFFNELEAQLSPAADKNSKSNKKKKGRKSSSPSNQTDEKLMEFCTNNIDSCSCSFMAHGDETKATLMELTCHYQHRLQAQRSLQEFLSLLLQKYSTNAKVDANGNGNTCTCKEFCCNNNNNGDAHQNPAHFLEKVLFAPSVPNCEEGENVRLSRKQVKMMKSIKPKDHCHARHGAQRCRLCMMAMTGNSPRKGSLGQEFNTASA
ncbi:unnamed protein product [Caenorhabditis auriculariae]|uniref:Uncharacterized protein n=1 Tax=Caenorhabditis auriculariae TaxID=2777116 RepID=A0A8S1HH96_9PELO|nr:unnamed protein product [Caenorhabditis auriculariae]